LFVYIPLVANGTCVCVCVCIYVLSFVWYFLFLFITRLPTRRNNK